MTQLVLIDAEAHARPADIVECLDAGNLPDTPIVLLDWPVDAAPEAGTALRLETVAAGSGPAAALYVSTRTGRRTLILTVGAGHEAALPDVLRHRLEDGLDTICLIAGGERFPQILSRIERTLFAVLPQVRTENVTASFRYFNQLFDEFSMARMTGSEPGGERPLTEATRALADGPGKGRAETLAGGMLDRLEAGTELATRPGQFMEDALSCGLQFVRERLRAQGQQAWLLADGTEGIFAYGPNTQLEPGRYCASFLIDTDEAAPGAELRLRLDAILNGGDIYLAEAHATLAAGSGKQPVELVFDVPDDPDRGEARTETRLWVEGGEGEVELLAYELARIEGEA